jgi:[1-hydroxy-2-(trimethylamino)ethyl]phosphonate dioxygenase
MIRPQSIEALNALYAAKGGLGYGEGVTQLEHALQCAALAEAAGAGPSLVLAALLHDVGHLFEEEAAVVGADTDHRHEVAGAQALKHLYGEAVRSPIALHVAAKRYLCAVEPGYLKALSPASQASLVLQGGPFGPAEVQAFEHRPYWREAVALRRFDDEGKSEEPSGRSFADYLPLMRALAQGA